MIYKYSYGCGNIGFTNGTGYGTGEAFGYGDLEGNSWSYNRGDGWRENDIGRSNRYADIYGGGNGNGWGEWTFPFEVLSSKEKIFI